MIKAEHGKCHQLGLDVRSVRESGKDRSIETRSFTSQKTEKTSTGTTDGIAP